MQGYRMSGLKIVEYSKRDFLTLVDDECFWKTEQLPISRRRCSAQTLNPRAEDGDILLIAAYSENRLVSYIGILPDVLFIDQDSPVKFGWLTTWWADKNSEYRLAATMVLFSAIKRYSGRVAISAFTPDAKRIYDASRRFTECARFRPVYFVLSLPEKIPVLGTATRRLSRYKNKLLLGRRLGESPLSIKKLDLSDQSVQSFLTRRLRADPFARDLTYWRWALEHPWISSSDEDREQQKRYQFSVFSAHFEQRPVSVRHHGEVIGLLFLRFRDGQLSLLFAVYDPKDIEHIARALKLTIIDVNPWVFISSDEALNSVMRRGLPIYLSALRRRPVQAYSSFPMKLPSHSQYGIGDNIFT